MELDCEPETERFHSKFVRYSARGRHYSSGAHVRIVEESFSCGERVEDVARRHGISRGQLHAWRKAYDTDLDQKEAGQLVSFAPVVIGTLPLDAVPTVTDSVSAHGRMEIICLSGHRVIVSSDVDRAALRLVLDVLER